MIWKLVWFYIFNINFIWYKFISYMHRSAPIFMRIDSINQLKITIELCFFALISSFAEFFQPSSQTTALINSCNSFHINWTILKNCCHYLILNLVLLIILQLFKNRYSTLTKVGHKLIRRVALKSYLTSYTVHINKR
jgi:hypothetical protein